MPNNRKGGLIEVTVDGSRLSVKGAVDYGLGKPVREAIVGHDGQVHGYKETFVAPFIELEITDSEELSLDQLANVTDSTIVVSLANGKGFAIRNAWCVNQDGLGGNSEEGAIKLRFEGKSAEEI